MSWAVTITAHKSRVLDLWDAYWSKYTTHAPPPSQRIVLVEALAHVEHDNVVVRVRASGHFGRTFNSGPAHCKCEFELEEIRLTE